MTHWARPGLSLGLGFLKERKANSHPKPHVCLERRRGYTGVTCTIQVSDADSIHVTGTKKLTFFYVRDFVASG